MLFPIDWPEPFGIVMIEAMACGTPVVAFRAGSAPEVIDEGVSGYLVNDVAEAVLAVQRVENFDRAKARACFERRFTIDRVARDYVNIYCSLAGVRIAAPRVRRATGWGAPVAPTVSVFGEVLRTSPVSTPALVRLPARSRAARESFSSVDREGADRSPALADVDDDVPIRAAEGDVEAAAFHSQSP